MRAIIETGGKQFTVAPEKTIRVPSIDGEPGDEITFDRVLYAAGDSVHIGGPTVAGATVKAEIVKHGRGKKITVFRMKRRKRYRRRTGHRQNFTELRITGVSLKERDGETAAVAPDSKAADEAGEEAVFVCDLCGNEYDTARGLSIHKSRSHKE